MDTPWHYHPMQDAKLPHGSQPSLMIDQMPLGWFFTCGVKLDFRHFTDGYVVSADDIAVELVRIGRGTGGDGQPARSDYGPIGNGAIRCARL